MIVGEKQYSMVSPWMENGSIVGFLRENVQANPLKLVGLFYFMHHAVDSGHSWRMLHAVFSIFMVWISHTVISKEYDFYDRFR